MNEKLKRRILYESARLLHNRKEADGHKARIRAARSVSRGWIHPADLPDPRQIIELVRQIELGTPPDDYSTRVSSLGESERFEAFEKLLRPLAFVGQNRKRHPEGDVLYHSLQVFELVCDEVPYDEDLLLAGLLHDVGRGFDPKNHTESALNALSGLISERTAWLIENHMIARGLIDGTIGIRARRRLAAHDDFESLEILVHADVDGRQPGMQVRDLDEVLTYIRTLATQYEEFETGGPRQD